MAHESDMAGEGRCLVEALKLTVFDCEVQHPASKGPFTPDKGIVGLAVVILPTGQPKIVLEIRHPDGTALHANLGGGEVATLERTLAEKDAEATQISGAAGKATRQ
jgi:hypothetical protein